LIPAFSLDTLVLGEAHYVQKDTSMPKQEQLVAIQDQLPLSPAVFHMLLALSEGERHGYALKREIAQRTNGKLKLGPGVLYGSINKMLEAGLIEESDERPDAHLDDERRRYYRITNFGRRVAQAEAMRMRELVAIADRNLGFARA
jgi:DNA-binding PadR family transcriptional regulator